MEPRDDDTWFCLDPAARIALVTVLSVLASDLVEGIGLGPLWTTVLLVAAIMYAGAAIGHALAWRSADDRRGLAQRAVVSAVLFAVTASSAAVFPYNWWSGERDARAIVAAAKQYKADEGLYPGRLENLVPRYLDHVPYAAIRLAGHTTYAYLCKTICADGWAHFDCAEAGGVRTRSDCVLMWRAGTFSTFSIDFDTDEVGFAG